MKQKRVKYGNELIVMKVIVIYLFIYILLFKYIIIYSFIYLIILL